MEGMEIRSRRYCSAEFGPDRPSVARIADHQRILHRPRISSLKEFHQSIITAIIAACEMGFIYGFAFGENAPLIALNTMTIRVIWTNSKKQIGPFSLKTTIEIIAFVLTRDAFKERRRKTRDFTCLPNTVLDYSFKVRCDGILVHCRERLPVPMQDFKSPDEHLVQNDEYFRFQLGVWKLRGRRIAGITPAFGKTCVHFFLRRVRNASR